MATRSSENSGGKGITENLKWIVGTAILILSSFVSGIWVLYEHIDSNHQKANEAEIKRIETGHLRELDRQKDYLKSIYEGKEELATQKSEKKLNDLNLLVSSLQKRNAYLEDKGSIAVGAQSISIDDMSISNDAARELLKNDEYINKQSFVIQDITRLGWKDLGTVSAIELQFFIVSGKIQVMDDPSPAAEDPRFMRVFNAYAFSDERCNAAVGFATMPNRLISEISSKSASPDIFTEKTIEGLKNYDYSKVSFPMYVSSVIGMVIAYAKNPINIKAFDCNENASIVTLENCHDGANNKLTLIAIDDRDCGYVVFSASRTNDKLHPLLVTADTWLSKVRLAVNK